VPRQCAGVLTAVKDGLETVSKWRG
jgi:hypothetical protein